MFQRSDLARRPTEAGKALDAAGEVTISRGSQTLRISQPEHDLATVISDMCGLLGAVVATEPPERVCVILNAAWPWTRMLPTDDQIELAAEVGPLAETCDDQWRKPHARSDVRRRNWSTRCSTPNGRVRSAGQIYERHNATAARTCSIASPPIPRMCSWG